MLPNLKKVKIKNQLITQVLLNELSLLHLEQLSLENCNLRDNLSFNKLMYLNELSLVNCSFVNDNIFKNLNSNLKSISIINPFDENIIDLTIFTQYNQLASLILEKCIVNNLIALNDLPKLQILSLLYSDISSENELNVLLNLPKLNTLYISEDYQDLEIVQQLMKKINVHFA